MVMPDADLYARRRGVLKRGWIDIPDSPGTGGIGGGIGGTGAAGKLLEELLGINGGNSDTPDAGKWEIKFHSGNALLTLFHQEAKPRRHLCDMLREFGRQDDKGRISFRHTIFGRSEKGFDVVNKSHRISVCHPDIPDSAGPYWTHNMLITRLASKLRRLIVVRGQKRKNQVRYDVAHRYWEPKLTSFVEAIERGTVAIDFDARTNKAIDFAARINDKTKLRNHGTKFRIRYDDLRGLYENHQGLDGS